MLTKCAQAKHACLHRCVSAQSYRTNKHAEGYGVDCCLVKVVMLHTCAQAGLVAHDQPHVYMGDMLKGGPEVC